MIVITVTPSLSLQSSQQVKQPICTIPSQYIIEALPNYDRVLSLSRAAETRGGTNISKICLSYYLIQLLSPPFIASFCLLTLVAKSRNGSSSNDRSSRKEKSSRRTPSVTGQEADQEGIGLRTHTFLSAMSFLFCFFMVRFFFDVDRGTA